MSEEEEKKKKTKRLIIMMIAIITILFIGIVYQFVVIKKLQKQVDSSADISISTTYDKIFVEN